MAKNKNENEMEIITTEEVVSTPNFDRWKAGVLKNNPDLTEDSDMEELYAASSAGYDAEHDYAKKERQEVERLGELLSKHPELASFFDSVVNAEDEDLGTAFLNLGELITAYSKGEIDSAAYKAGMEEKKRKDKEVATKSEAQAAAFEKACEEMDVNPEETSQELMEKLFNPMAAYELTVEAWKGIIKMLHYDDDVVAAEVRGRNANITAQRKKMENSTDGIPHRPSASVQTTTKSNSPLDSMVDRRTARRKL
jgi:hypothetical protein